MSRPYVLDAFALMAFLNGEPGGERVKELLEGAEREEIPLLMHLVNLIEVYYTVYREDGEAKANEVYLWAQRLPITFCPLEIGDVARVGALKGSYRISLADAFAAALSQGQGGALVTGDPEFKELEGIIQIEWLAKTT